MVGNSEQQGDAGDRRYIGTNSNIAKARCGVEIEKL